MDVCDVLYSKQSEVVVEDADNQTDHAEELIHQKKDLDLSNSFLKQLFFQIFKSQHSMGKKIFEGSYNNGFSDFKDEEINASTASEIVQTENEKASFLKKYINALDNLTAQVKPSAKDANIFGQTKML